MAHKIMLVEDDTNLSEIYKARLEAESFQVISAADGEEALALAVKEHPDLIISDVMMPKVSGFDMLDILRGTEGIKNTRVIMMTALGQAEDKDRADKLGADRYLVKSQVTLEDVVRTVHEVLGDAPEPPESTTPADSATATLASAAEPTVPTVATPTAQIPMATPPTDIVSPPAPSLAVPPPPLSADTASQAASAATTSSSGDEQAAVLSQIQDFVNQQEATAPDSNKTSGSTEGHIPKVIQPTVPVPAAPTPVATMTSPQSSLDPVAQPTRDGNNSNVIAPDVIDPSSISL